MIEPAWLQAAVDQRLALFQDKIGAQNIPIDTNLIMTPLTEPPEGADDLMYRRWDRSCDNCGTYCPSPHDFYTGHVVRMIGLELRLFITFGVCPDCRRRFPLDAHQ